VQLLATISYPKNAMLSPCRYFGTPLRICNPFLNEMLEAFIDFRSEMKTNHFHFIQRDSGPLPSVHVINKRATSPLIPTPSLLVYRFPYWPGQIRHSVQHGAHLHSTNHQESRKIGQDSAYKALYGRRHAGGSV